MTLDRIDVSARFRALQAQQPPIALGLPPKPRRYHLDYGTSPDELAVEVALIRGALRLHPTFHNQAAFVSLLTPTQRAIYARMPR